MAVANAIGGVFLALSIYPLALTYLPPKAKTATAVRIKLGLPQFQDKVASLAGDKPAVSLFNSNGERIGFTLGGGHIEEDSDTKPTGDIQVMHINQEQNSFAEYISISATGSDAICISSITITMAADDQPNFALFGDIPISSRGQDVSLQRYKTTGKTTNDIKQGISWHVTDFLGHENRIEQYNTHPDTMCKSIPRLQMWDYMDPLHCVPIFWPPLPDSKGGLDQDTAQVLSDTGSLHCDMEKGQQLLYPSNKPNPRVVPSSTSIRRLRKAFITSGRNSRTVFRYPPGSDKRRSIDVEDWELSANILDSRVPELNQKTDSDCPSVHANRIVISEKETHNGGAKELCEAPNSWGPDFVSTLEGKFCDMCTRHLWDICSDKITTACFDMTTSTVRPGNGIRGRDFFGRAIPVKNYTTVLEWK
ncbi:uncharacterized protein BP5553_02680 [Venustampulla echinocandica]|uniref:Uncharacterized protein n=1 Tax=Venustampulla echinocandica TaxID=2656787 RepID=A0A370TS35_9HELO|nr:uncharacterized protein BP5553_02680 [Venustampulla echinocandica]RDL38340.1 hypothetical protein BP5553_02680 [Venustampulla echinocandica]